MQTNISDFLGPGAVPVTAPPQHPPLILRITFPDKKWNRHKVCTFLDEVSPRYAICNEKSKRGVCHHHCVIERSLEIESFRMKFKEAFTECNSGSKYNLQEAEDLHKSLQYIVKDVSIDSEKEEFYSLGYPKDFFDRYKKTSKKKFDIDEYQVKLKKFQEKYMLNETYEKLDLLTDWSMLNAQYSKPLNYSHVNNYIEMLNIKKYGEDRDSVRMYIQARTELY